MGSAHPRIGNKTTPRPPFSAASATARGRLPPPQMTASGPISDKEGSTSLLKMLLCLRAANRHCQRSRPCADERNDCRHKRVIAVLRCDLCHAFPKGAGAEKHCLVSAAYPLDLHFGPATPAHANNIEADEVGKRSLHQPERNHICSHSAHAHHHSTLADPHELAHRRLASKNNEIADRHMPAKHDIICESDVVSDLAVMTDVGPDHQKTSVSHFGHTSVILRPRIHCDILANIAIGTNDEPSGSAAIFHRLGRGSERYERMDRGTRSDDGMPSDLNMACKP